MNKKSIAVTFESIEVFHLVMNRMMLSAQLQRHPVGVLPELLWLLLPVIRVVI